MLVIKVELHPFGDSNRAVEIARMKLWNDGSGSVMYGNYMAEATSTPSPWRPAESHRGQVTSHHRAESIWNLIQKMLSNLVPAQDRGK